MATVESIIYGALKTLAAGNVFPDVAPGGFQLKGIPWITYQAVGGNVYATLDGNTPVTRNARVQVAVWAHTRLAAADLMEQVFQSLANSTVQAVPIGAPVSVFESETLMYGSRIDFSVTYS
ncbi:DUF3168 domain-containing protein [Burkholderia cenocepacia]|nr:DUF3168 domain-containing protein [Burkholderia cenocepacia]